MAKGFDNGTEDVKTLIKALNDKPKFDRLCIYTLNCFGSLARNRQNLDKMVELGSIPSIISTMERHTGNSRIILEAARPLISAAKIDEHAAVLVKEGSIEFALKYLESSNDAASNTQMTELLNTLMGKSNDYIQKVADLGGEDILNKILKNSIAKNNEALAASAINCLEKLSSIPKTCKELKIETIENVVKTMEAFPGNKKVANSSLNIILNLFEHRNMEEIIQILRNLGCVKIISKIIDANSTDFKISSLSKKVLEKLSEESDLKHALQQIGDKSLEHVQRIEAVSMVGNLSTLSANIDMMKDNNALEKLYKIIKTLVGKFEKCNDENKKLLATSIISAGKVAALNEKGAVYYNKNIIDCIKKLQKKEKLSSELSSSILVSFGEMFKSEPGYAALIKNTPVIEESLKKSEMYKKDHSVVMASINLQRNLGRKSQGLNFLVKGGYIAKLCDNIEANINNEELVILSFKALIKYADNIECLQESDIEKIVKTVLNVLRKNPENIEICTEAIEVLQIYADRSEFTCKLLSQYEYASVLSKFKNETEEESLKLAIDRLKASLKEKKKGKQIGLAECLEAISIETKKIVSNEDNKEFLEAVYLNCEILNSALVSQDNIDKFNSLDGKVKLCEFIKNVKKAKNSVIKEDILISFLTILNMFDDKEAILHLLKTDMYSTFIDIYNDTQSEQIKGEIKKLFDKLLNLKNSYIKKLETLDPNDPNYSTICKNLIEKIAEIDIILKKLPEELRPEFCIFEKEIDIAINLIQKNCNDRVLVLAAISLLDVVADDDSGKKYLVSTYLDSLCEVVKGNAENEFVSTTMIGLLNNYESADAFGKITDLKAWYINKALETDVEALKLYLLEKIYEILNDKEKEVDLKNFLNQLQYCYDPNNKLVDINAIATRTDEEVVKLIAYILKEKNFGKELKKAVIKLIGLMVLNKNIEKLFYDSGVLSAIIDLINSCDKKDRDLYFSALAPFLLSSNILIRDFCQREINKMIINSFDMNEDDRFDLLDDLINNAEDGSSILKSTQCLDSIIRLFELQKKPEGKAKCLSMINKMCKASEEINSRLVQGRGMKLILEAFDEFIDSPRYIEQMTALMVTNAGYNSAVDKMFDYEIDKKMKNLMFQYSNNKEIFHSAQRTIDLMYLVKLNLTPEQLKIWKARSRIKQLMTELCRGIGIMISSVLTKGEREVRTGDTAKDISQEALRILNEYGTSFDDAIETDSPTRLLTWLAEAWLLRANLMAYTFLVEKDVSARSYLNAPHTIPETLVAKCGFTALWDFENNDFENQHRCVRGGIGHQSVRVMLDASIDAQSCQEIDLVTKEPMGREYSLEDLITWVKMDTEEQNTLRCFNLVLSWVNNNWNHVTITASMIANNLDEKLVEKDGAFLALRCGLNWEWERRIDIKNNYIMKADKGEYNVVGSIKEKKTSGGLHIKVNMSGEELREKRREIKDQLDFSHSNVLNGDEKEDLDFFIDISNKGTSCRRYTKQLLKVKEDKTFIKFNQEEDGDLYFSWGDENAEFKKRERFNMKEIEQVVEGKNTKVMKKSKTADENCVFSLVAAGDREINLQLPSKGDRDTWVNGLKLVLATVASRRPVDMIW